MLVLFEKLIGSLCTLFGLLLGVVIALMCVEIGLQALRLGSLRWLSELTEYLMYAGTFLSAPWVLRQGSHVRVDMLLVAVPRRVAIRIEQAVDVCGLLISLVLLYYGSAVVADAWRTDMVQYKTWAVPEWLLLLAIPAGAAMLAAEFVLRILRVRGVVREAYSIADRPSI